MTNTPIINDGSGNCFEILFNSPYPVNEQEFVPWAFFNNMESCLAPLSAGTEYTTCVICCPCSGTQSVTSRQTPHPVWTNNTGMAVVLLDAVQLGGMNGLNS